jgi:Fe-S cluster assembly protein SufD
VNPAEESFAKQLDAALSASSSAPAFLRRLREEARETFLRVKLPTQKHEDWRFTSLAALSAQPWRPAPRASASAADLPPAPRLVFVNGHLDGALTDLSGLPPGARAGSLGAALRERPQAIEPHLGRCGDWKDHAFAALSAGLFEDGALVELPDGAAAQEPIHLVFLSRPDGAPAAAHPRTLVVAGEGARATVVETFRGEGLYLVNAFTELALGAGAEVEHERIQEEGGEAFHVGLLGVAQAARTKLTSTSMALGGALARVEERAVLAGEGASCELDGLYLAQGSQLLDQLVHVDHASPRCTSRQTFKGILGDRARGVFAGRILVRPGAQKTDAAQVNSNLLLSDDATIDTKPQLEILADDVKCSHGGTVGQIPEDQLFYLRSRGIDLALARALLTWAFASEMVQKVGAADVRSRVRAAVTARLPGGAMLETA